MTVYGGPDALYDSLLEFTAQSRVSVSRDGETYNIHHCQFGRYPVSRLFNSLLDYTDANPLETDDGSDELVTANGSLGDELRELSDCVVRSIPGLIDDYTEEFDSREGVRVRDIVQAERSYERRARSDIPDLDDVSGRYQNLNPTATTREEAFAELLSLVNLETAMTAQRHRYDTKLTDDTPPSSDDLSSQEEINRWLTSVYATATTGRTNDSLKRPDPDYNTVASIFDLCEAVEYNPSLRDVYTFLVHPHAPEYASGEDSDNSVSETSIRGETGKWKVDNE